MTARMESICASAILLIVTIIVILVHVDTGYVKAEEIKSERIEVQVMPGLKSGMPCDLYTQQSQEEQVIEEGEHEQETSEEETQEATATDGGQLNGTGEVDEQPGICEVTESGDGQGEAEDTGVQQQYKRSPQDLLREHLESAGIGWWYPYAVAQMTQESQGNPWAENPNGLDKGLFQYRITYWTEPESIFDVNAQIRRYVREVFARINAGLSIEEIISRHYTSDYVTGIDWQYVNDVLKWMR